MKTTSISLLERLKIANPAEADWNRLQDIYLPLIRQWLGRIPGLGSEVDDLAQEVLIVVFREIQGFQRQREGSFRAWLRQVTINRVRTYLRQHQRRPTVLVDPTDQFLDQLADPNGNLACQWDLEHDRHVFQKLLALIRPDFSAQTWEAFQRYAIEGLPAIQVAEELGMEQNAVLKAKSRVLKRLREEAGELLD